MQTSKKARIIAFCRENTKYVVLFGIYMLCLVPSVMYDPWNEYYSYEWQGEVYNEVYSPMQDFYDDYRYYLPGPLSDEDSVAGWVIARVLSFGVGDLIGLSSLSRGNRDRRSYAHSFSCRDVFEDERYETVLCR